jgi:hypothetical protein
MARDSKNPMSRPRLDSARVTCHISKEAATRLDRLLDEIYLAGKTGWQDPNFKPLFEVTKHALRRPMGRKPLGLVLSRLILKAPAEILAQIVEEVRPKVHTEHAHSGEPQHWKLSKYGGGLFRNEDTKDGSSERRLVAYDGFSEHELQKGFLPQVRRKKRMSIAEEVRAEMKAASKDNHPENPSD